MSDKKDLRVAIDGPAGAGKSSLAKALAQALKLSHIDTGSMYRAVAYKAINSGIALDDDVKLSEMLDNLRLEVVPDEQGQKIILDGEDISGQIRTQEISNGASAVSRRLVVREKLVDYQKKLASKGNVIMDGRDIGTVVMPDAPYKFFINASEKERSKRRFIELEGVNKLDGKAFETISSEIKSRDYEDSNREHSPLQKAHDAIEIDTTEMDFNQVYEYVLGILKSGRS